MPSPPHVVKKDLKRKSTHDHDESHEKRHQRAKASTSERKPKTINGTRRAYRQALKDRDQANKAYRKAKKVYHKAKAGSDEPAVIQPAITEAPQHCEEAVTVAEDQPTIFAAPQPREQTVTVAEVHPANVATPQPNQTPDNLARPSNEPSTFRVYSDLLSAEGRAAIVRAAEGSKSQPTSLNGEHKTLLSQENDETLRPSNDANNSTESKKKESKRQKRQRKKERAREARAEREHWEAFEAGLEDEAEERELQLENAWREEFEEDGGGYGHDPFGGFEGPELLMGDPRDREVAEIMGMNPYAMDWF